MIQQAGLTLSHFVIIGALVFYVGLLGMILNKRSLIHLLLCIELLLLAVNINFVAFAHFSDGLFGHVAAFFVLTVAAAEAALGLAIVMIFFRNRGSIALGSSPLLRSCPSNLVPLRDFLRSRGPTPSNSPDSLSQEVTASGGMGAPFSSGEDDGAEHHQATKGAE